MPIYFKFFSAKEYDSISFDGSVISVDALKRKILELKYEHKNNGLCLGTDSDLVLFNAQTNDSYVDDMLIPNNSRVLVRRVPGTRHRMPINTATITLTEKQQPLNSSYCTGSSSVTEKRQPLSSSYCTGSSSSGTSSQAAVADSSRSTTVNAGASSMCASTVTNLSSTKCSGDIRLEYDDGFGNDVFVIHRMKPVQSSKSTLDEEFDEDSKIKALVNTPALDWKLEGCNGVGFWGGGMNGRGFGGSRKKIPPEGYICHRCKVPGHFIQYCPTNGDPNYDFKRLKPPTGIPKSMLVPNPDGSYELSSGATAVLQPKDEAFEKEILGCFPSKRSWCVNDIPPELLCPLCNQLMRDAVLSSRCCLKSFCDSCIRVHLITSKLTCACGATNILADYLIPNMTLRDTINRISQSGSGYSSSGENAKSKSFQVKDMESAHCSQPHMSTTKLSAESIQEDQKSSPIDVKDGANKRKLVDSPHPITKKARTTGAVDVSEATIGSTRVKNTASRGSVLGVEEEGVLSGEGEKKKKEREVIKDEVEQKVVSGQIGKKKRGSSQATEAKRYMVPVGSYAYNPYWAGVQVNLGHIAPYYSACAMRYGSNGGGR